MLEDNLDFGIHLFELERYFNNEYDAFSFGVDGDKLQAEWLNNNEEWIAFKSGISKGNLNRLLSFKDFHLASIVTKAFSNSVLTSLEDNYTVDTSDCIELTQLIEYFSTNYHINNSTSNSYLQCKSEKILFYFFLLEASHNGKPLNCTSIQNNELYLRLKQEIILNAPSNDALVEMLFVSSLLLHCCILSKKQRSNSQHHHFLNHLDKCDITHEGTVVELPTKPSNLLARKLSMYTSFQNFFINYPGKDNWERVIFDLNIDADLLMSSFDDDTLTELFKETRFDIKIKQFSKCFSGKTDSISLALRIIDSFIFSYSTITHDAMKETLSSIMAFNRALCSREPLEWMEREFQLIKYLLIAEILSGQIDISLKDGIPGKLYLRRFKKFSSGLWKYHLDI
ncbi:MULTISPECIES: hypothetical protein [Providencia]|uniref:hypothetical protein n=1 Tax=Providencia TaxID=586 RepID=UPI0011839CE8|nr:hypothetical protein [Providencia rettgeri]EMB6211357.1 hypothetical protein [Morganella morganii]